jgi:hypothetical protein
MNNKSREKLKIFLRYGALILAIIMLLGIILDALQFI